jgi:hypothetical protein
MKCNRHIAYCKCEDMDQRLKELAHTPQTELVARDGIAARGRTIDPNIELLLDTRGKKVKVTFESKRYAGLYWQTGIVYDVEPSHITMQAEDTNYPEGRIQFLNTSRLRAAECIEGGEKVEGSEGQNLS